MYRFLASLIVALTTLTAGVLHAAKARKPNVIVVITDDQGYGDIAAHGNQVIKTPALDALMKESTRLTNFHVDPTCAPTRSALMTGRYSGRVGVWHTIMGRSLLRRDEKTMADAFRAGGYRTAIFGKWHLDDNYPFRPQDRGFDDVLVCGGGGVGQTPDYWGNDYFDDTYWQAGTPRKFTGYCTDIWFNGALKFIEANRERPFFCYLTTNAPHGPYHVAEKYSQLYADNKNVPNANFYGMITNIDENVARLVSQLKKMNLEENTILIFMTDNGTAAGIKRGKGGDIGFNAGMRGQKGSEYEGGHRVPCFIRWPGGKISAGKDSDRLAAHVDLLPTLIDLCGLPQPSNAKFDGRSLKPLLLESNPQWPERTLFVESQRIEHPEKWRKSSVMTDRWRLVNGRELYDIAADSSQKKDLASGEQDVVKSLRNSYDRWWDDVSQRHDEYCNIVLGSKHENPARLTAHDWHASIRNVPWNQGHIRQEKLYANGFWAVDVERAGRYRFTLCRQPRQEGAPLLATEARLKIGDVDVKKPVKANDTEATFEITLKPGLTRLKTWLSDTQKEKQRGAYFVYVQFLEKS